MAASRRARAPCRRQAAAAAAAHSIETSTLHFGGPDLARLRDPKSLVRGNLCSIEPSRELAFRRLSGRGAWAHPRCQSHDCLNAICGAAAEGVAQVETGHGEPVGKTHSSERGPSLARQLGSGHAHAARQRWTAARVGLGTESRGADCVGFALDLVRAGFRVPGSVAAERPVPVPVPLILD